VLLVNTFFDWCRLANVFIGPVAFGCLCYRAVIGLHNGYIVYRPLFILFCGYVLTAAISAPTGITLGNTASFLAAVLLVLNVALITTCVFYPGPLKKEVH
jgi:hypothetical protein